jgi:DNA-binding NarL/FixJ family response regulator
MDNRTPQDAQPMTTIRVLIADDHPLFRFGISALLNSLPDVVVVGEATTGEEAARLAETLQPDVILMDIQMPGINGIEATRRILEARPEARILVVTMFDDDASVFTAMRAGARGYVLKDSEKSTIVRAIRAAGQGEAIFSPAIAARLIDFFAAAPTVPRAVFPALTEREREILGLIAQGRSNTDIAQELALSAKTVANYVSSIFNKLQVADRSQAIVRARDAGLGGDTP